MSSGVWTARDKNGKLLTVKYQWEMHSNADKANENVIS